MLVLAGAFGAGGCSGADDGPLDPLADGGDDVSADTIASEVVGDTIDTGTATDTGATDSLADTGLADTGLADTGSLTDGAATDSGCVDTCPATKGGVTWGCKKRFLYGLNYAWRNFGGDFGGIAAWSQKGVAASLAAYDADLADMRAHGVSVVRWWMFPEFRGEGVTVDSSGTATGLGATTLADLSAAIDLAEKHDLYLMLTPFSFDGFRPARTTAGLFVPSLQPMVVDAARRTALLEKVIRPIAKAIAAHKHRDRVMSWDIINEPEWAIKGTDAYGDPAFEPNAELTAVTHPQMQTFIADVVAVLRAESTAKISVGAAAFKWAKAWSKIDQDFYQFHMYGWIDTYWPYSKKPADFGLGDKPLVMGEFPLGPLNATPFAKVLESWYANGYAGAMAWQYGEAKPTELADVKAFADLHPCETRL